jgi:hypothetical protein
MTLEWVAESAWNAWPDAVEYAGVRRVAHDMALLHE